MHHAARRRERGPPLRTPADARNIGYTATCCESVKPSGTDQIMARAGLRTAVLTALLTIPQELACRGHDHAPREGHDARGVAAQGRLDMVAARLRPGLDVQRGRSYVGVGIARHRGPTRRLRCAERSAVRRPTPTPPTGLTNLARKPGQLDPDQPLLERLHGWRAASACTGSSAAPAASCAQLRRDRDRPRKPDDLPELGPHGLDLLHLPGARRRHRDADAQSERLLEPRPRRRRWRRPTHASHHPDEPARERRSARPRSTSPGAPPRMRAASACTGSSAAPGPSCGNFAEITTVPGNQTTFQNSSLTASTSYTYRVRADDTVTPTPNQSGYSNLSSATTLAPPATDAAHHTRRTCPQARSARARSTSPGAPPSDAGGIARVPDRALLRAPSCGNFAEIATVPGNQTTFKNSGLSGLDLLHLQGARRHGRRRPIRAATRTSASATTLAPPDTDAAHHTRRTCTASAVGSSQINLSWSASTDRRRRRRVPDRALLRARAAATSPRSRPSPATRRPSRTRASRPRPPTPTGCAPTTP